MKIIKIKKIITNIFRIIKVIQYQKTLWQMFVSVNAIKSRFQRYKKKKREMNTKKVKIRYKDNLKNNKIVKINNKSNNNLMNKICNLLMLFLDKCQM